MKKADLTLGAAQLGMEYGVANRAGKMPVDAAMAFLYHLTERGVTSIDTSPLYGESETLIGRFIKETGASLEITTKLPPLEVDARCSSERISEMVLAAMQESLGRLQVGTVANYLIHSEPDFLRFGERLIVPMVRCREKGMARGVGVSVYSPEAALQAIRLGVDCLQVPCNLFDGRFERAGVFTLARQQGVRIFARSVFLQGLFFLEPDCVAAWLPEAADPLRQLRKLAQRLNRPVAEIALVHVRDRAAITSLVVGMETAEQLDRNLALMQADELPAHLEREIGSLFAAIPERVVNPSLWRCS